MYKHYTECADERSNSRYYIKHNIHCKYVIIQQLTQKSPGRRRPKTHLLLLCCGLWKKKKRRRKKKEILFLFIGSNM
jgi:hypothetical protein